MEKRDALEFYVDYLIASTQQATATGLSAVLDHQLKHDYISDCLAQRGLDNKTFWKEIKPFVRKIEAQEAVLSIDDTIVEKPHTTENEVVTYHFDHTKGKAVKGINLLNFLLSSQYEGQVVNCPVAFEVIRKTEAHTDKHGNTKFKSPKTKNEMVLEHLHRLIFLNKVKFRYVLFDSWFSASPTLKILHTEFKKTFVCPLKVNRLVALSYENKMKGQFQSVSSIKLESGSLQQVYIKGLDFPVCLVRQVFKNKDGSTAELFLVTNDIEMNYDRITTIYQKRWKVEETHKSLKQNTLLGNSPTKMETTQCNHIFASMLAFIKLERLKVKERLNHFALKAKLYLRMLKAAFEELGNLQAA